MSVDNERYWYIVEFDDGVQVVPEIWLDGNTCFWPPFKSTQRYEKAVKQYEEPCDDWSSYPVKILGKYSSYETARPNLKTAEDHTDLDVYDAKEKRHLKKKRPIISSSDESENEEPVIRISKYPSMTKTKTSTQHCFESSNRHSVGNVQSVLNKRCAEAQSSQNVSFINSPHRESPVPSSITKINPSVHHQSSSPRTLSRADDEFKEKLLKDVSFIKINIIKIQQNLQTMQNRESDNVNNETEQNSYQQEISDSFPLKTSAELEAVERKLMGVEYKNHLIHYLSRIGGYKINEITKLILVKLFDDKLGRQFSWLGLKNKKKFVDLRLSDVTLKSVKLNPAGKDATEKDIIDAIKNWLRHCKARDQNKEKRVDPGLSQEEEN